MIIYNIIGLSIYSISGHQSNIKTHHNHDVVTRFRRRRIIVQSRVRVVSKRLTLALQREFNIITTIIILFYASLTTLMIFKRIIDIVMPSN